MMKHCRPSTSTVFAFLVLSSALQGVAGTTAEVPEETEAVGTESALVEDSPSVENQDPCLGSWEDRIARLERRIVDQGDVLVPRAVGDPLADLERRVQRLEMQADPTTDLRQLDSRLRALETRLIRLESDIRSLRRN